MAFASSWTSSSRILRSSTRGSRDHPDRYIWSDGPEPPNNWIASFGGPAWSRDERTGRLFLHSFYAEQPDLDWRNPELREAMSGVVRFWIDRGVDGFRIDAVDRMVKDAELRDDPPGRAPFPLPVHPDQQSLDLVNSRDSPGHRHRARDAAPGRR